ncbi:MAG: peptidoglycan DD-metalloendopeptidase family protein [Gammaproteobacteria bacterium]|nr:peptidoglycan DD-metalloendopeptidase family protein [Gammaproteobacteria bacterium]
MQYRSQLDVDYKQSSPYKSQKPHHYLLAGAIAVIVLSIMGAVIANVSTQQEKEIAQSQLPKSSQIETIELTLSNKSDATTDVKYAAPTTHSKDASKSEIISAQIQPLSSGTQNVQISTDQAVAKIETVTIKRGDTLSTLFSKRGLNTELHKIMQLGDKVKELKSVYPNQKLHFHVEDKTLIGIELETSVNRRLKVIKQEQDYYVDEIVRDFETRTQVASSTIENSLFLAGQHAGLSDSLIMELANVFGWDIDFALDIRTGDQFSVIYEEKYLDGEKIKDGAIIAAEFVNAGESYRAVRYTDSKGETDYYSQNGRSMRKPFLRTPVDFARISSRFNLKRKHPILNKIRAHKGVDYAASTGTPIKSSGDGKIIHRGTKGGYGRTIIVKHGSRYSTLYAHMHKYAKNTQMGKRIKQGQIIGYVGKSGLATGPHLHYEFRVNGVHRNPLTVKLPDASPLPKSEMARFKSATAEQFAHLDLYSSTILAQNQN